MSVHIDDAGIAVVIVTSSVVEVLQGDERCEPIDAVNVRLPCWPQSFSVSSTNVNAAQGHEPNFKSKPPSFVRLDLFL